MISYANNIDVTTRIEVASCCNCGIVFGLSAEFRSQRLKDRRTWYCPNGHGQHFTGKSDVERARERAEWAESRATSLADQLGAATRSNAALRGVVTKAKKRAAAGVCPCCQRTFQNVARHVAGQHPAFVKEHLGGEKA